MMKDENTQSQLVNGEIRICRHRINEITIFEITESDLDKLEKGSTTDLFLQFSIALLTLAISTTLTILTVKFNNQHIEIFFICLCIISYIAGLILFFLWRKTHQSIKHLIKEIRERPKS